MAIQIKNTKIRIKAFSEVELNCILGDHARYIEEILVENGLGNKEFVQKVLYNQLIEPKISIEEFLQLSDDDLETIGRAFIKNEGVVFGYDKGTGDFYKDFRIAFQSFKEKQSEIIKNIRKSLESLLIIRHDKTREHLHQNGWFITSYIEDKEIKDQLLSSDIFDKTNSQINEIYEDYFANDSYREIELMIKSWKTNKLFKPRISIFLSCLNVLRAFRKNKRNMKKVNPCSVLIPVLISQIDGIILEFARDKGLVLNSMRLKDKVTQQTFKNSEWLMKLPIGSYSEPHAVLLLHFVLFASTLPIGQENEKDKLKEKPKEVRAFSFYNRNKILHGEDIKYGTIDNLLRSFLILDFLAHLK